MQIEKHYKPEACASDGAARYMLQAVRLDTTDKAKPVLVSTDGKTLVCVPVVIDEGEESRTIPTKVFPAARKATPRHSPVSIGINGAYKLADGSILPTDPNLDEGQFPNWKQVCPEKDRKGAISLTFAPHLLRRVVEGLGNPEFVTIEFTPAIPDKGEGKDFVRGEPAGVIRITSSKAPGAFGLLMPGRDS